MQGSWSMVNDAGDTVAQGTWSAQRSKRGFQGKWCGAHADGRLLSTAASRPTSPASRARRSQDMFAATKIAQISGFWRMGRAKGAWYLKSAQRARLTCAADSHPLSRGEGDGST